MIKKRTAFLTFAVALMVANVISAPLTNASSEKDKTAVSVIRTTPAAPAIDDARRQAELSGRRRRVSESIGQKAILVLFSAEPRVYTNDVDYPFRQENNFYYLTNLKQKGAKLVLLPGNSQTPELLFLPRRNPAAETWTGHMYSPEEAAETSGIKEIWEASEFEPFLLALRANEAYQPKAQNILMTGAVANPGNGFETLFAAAAKNEAELHMLQVRGESREYRQEQRLAAAWEKTPGGFVIKNAFPLFTQMRLRKSPLELELMQHAIDISIEAHERAWVAAANAKWEYEIDAAVAYVYKLRNADNWGYPDIVGCGANATTLHYEESQSRCQPGDLLLMDVGAEYEHYSADVTRTTPINGKFSPAQAEIYQIVYDAQEAAAKVSRPGSSLSEIHRAASEVIKDGLLKLGLITDRNSNQYRLWFMHGTGHWLGMNVHDVGGGAKFEPGMTFTNEPGIYIRPDTLDYQPPGWSEAEWDKFKTAIGPAFQKYRGIGVRIEDDMVITPEGVRWMTEALPRKLSDVEAFIARARKEAR
jgi:Xaa-Pro aminopeptidase